MNVSLQSSQAGMQSSMRLHETAATRIANSTSSVGSSKLSEPASLESGTNTDDITTAVGDLIISEKGYTANAKVIKVQDQMMGALLDIVG